MNDVLFLSNANRSGLAPILDGTTAIARREHWNLQVIGGIASQKEVRRVLGLWRPVGCIVQNATETEIFDEADFCGIPLVFVDRDPASLTARTPTAVHDSDAAGRLAAETLMSLSMSHYAYARFSASVFWCRERRDAFVRTLHDRGLECLQSPDLVGDIHAIDHIKTANLVLKWLATLSKPVAVFAANDGLAEVLLNAAAKLGLNVPHDVAVLGVDDLPIICENTVPTLSSIHPNFSSAGDMAADLLSKLIAHGEPQCRHVKYGQSGVTRRQSTRCLPTLDATLNRVLEYIRTHAADASLRIADIAQVAGMSRRTVELRFRASIKHSILDEIHLARIQLAKRLLADGTVRISEVCAQSGFRSFATFSRIFTAATGVSPRQYRRSEPKSRLTRPL